LLANFARWPRCALRSGRPWLAVSHCGKPLGDQLVPPQHCLGELRAHFRSLEAQLALEAADRRAQVV
jgi:hypothetical protein